MTLLRGGKFRVLGSLSKVARDYHRVAFLAGALTSGLLHRLAVGPITLDALAADLRIGPARCDGLKAWLQAGVALGELGLQPAGYVAQGTLARMLTDPNNDAAAAFVEELACLHNTLLTQAPERLRTGHPFTLADQNARMVARSSRLVEPFVCEALAGVVPKHGPVTLLEIGCGAAAAIRAAARCNPEIPAAGVELQADVAALAMANIVSW